MDRNPEWVLPRTPLWRSPVFRRLAAAILVFACILTSFALFGDFAILETTPPPPPPAKTTPQVEPTSRPEVPNDRQSHAQKTWKKLRAKYDNFDDTKFTIALQTYRRPKELHDTLEALLRETIPSLLEIVVVWNDLEAKPPPDYTSQLGTPVRFRASARNSLNEKLLPDSTFRTQAILLSDDDVYYHPQDLEFAFQSWRKFGRNRLAGALARCSSMDENGKWKYTFCSNDGDDSSYSMIITNLAFSHISFLDYYSSDDSTMKEIREYVDQRFNCEDLAMNYVHSYLTGEGPLLIQGHKRYVNYLPSKGISTKKGHLQARSKCLNDFVEIFGTMPLINETAYVQRGVVVM
ncbi:hypothetical protein QQZ08_007241 [Neonectria magnoliae]|uniref:Glycosyl transferase 64 domain-containing protein n=1 Tax=Neonectria magnoliae TaxID=2732573 RepID=A0ABR1HZI8_9HYPO